MEKNCWILEKEELAKGTFRHVCWEDGRLCLEEDKTEGEYQSPIFRAAPFRKAVASWNASTPEGSHVEIQLRVWIQNGKKEEKPSHWYSWGIWGAHTDRKSVSVSEENAPDKGISMDTDTLILSEGEAVGFQWRALLSRKDDSPSLYLLGVSVPKREEEGEMASTGPVPWPQHLPLNAKTPVTPCSQLLRDPVFARVICSAVTIQMLAGRGNDDFLPEEIAWCDYDSAMDGHGNWSFSTAMAGELGYKAWAAYCSPEELLEELASGYPVGASVRYSNEPDHEKLPYLENAPGNTPGHLLVLYGYERNEKELWLLAADPYGEKNETVCRRYRWEQFLKAWSGRMTYFVRERKEGFIQKAIERIPVSFRKTGEGLYAVYSGENSLSFQEGEIGSCVFLPAEQAEKKKLSQYTAFYGAITSEGIKAPEEIQSKMEKRETAYRVMLVDHLGHTYEGYIE